MYLNMQPQRKTPNSIFKCALMEKSITWLKSLAGGVWNLLKASDTKATGIISRHLESSGDLWNHLHASEAIWNHRESSGPTQAKPMTTTSQDISKHNTQHPTSQIQTRPTAQQGKHRMGQQPTSQIQNWPTTNTQNTESANNKQEMGNSAQPTNNLQNTKNKANQRETKKR